MDHIDANLATATQNIRYSIAICAALAIGIKTLNRYYHKTDYSEVYRIAMGNPTSRLTITFIYQVSVLHPRHKLHYFKTAGWEDAWIETARNIVQDEFDRTYAFMDVEREVESAEGSNKVWSQNLFMNLLA